MPNVKTPQRRQAICPTCAQRTTFTYSGEQRWPSRVAEKMNVAPVMTLWHCDHCHTTLSEYELGD